MAVDEFGREIPAGRGRRDRPSSPSPSYGSPSRAPDGAPSHLYEALPTSRYGRDDRSSSRKRKHRSESPPPNRRAKPKPHPSTLYADEPMLCQYLWKEAHPDKNEKDYDEYRRSYCLNYVRTFFNEHMDDSWFRALYSPLGQYRVALQEQQRAAKEAAAFLAELEASLSSGSEKDGRCYFVLKARLGGGTKQARKLPGDDYHASPNKSRSTRDNGASTNANPVPATHQLAISNQILQVVDVPPRVTDEQLTAALMNHCSPDSKKSGPAVLYSSSTASDLTRTAYLCAPEDIRKEIISQLNHLDRGSGTAASSSADGAHVPRKEETYIPKLLELEVECSDAYGRMDVDADGKGGAPEEGGVPQRKASVWVSTQPLSTNVKVLSAAVSSRERIAEDQQATLKLAKAYDHRRSIPEECRLEELLTKAIPSMAEREEATPQDLEDALDMTIAYLRRVHLFSFYNGCAASNRVADVFMGKHATSTIHLRLANADSILQETREDGMPSSAQPSAPESTTPDPPKLDLLVQRLNDSVSKTLEDYGGWAQCSPVVVSDEVDAHAKDIEVQESQVEASWIEDHALIDEDGRARCSFHFCRKLFKDASFLKKHLIKKHSEFLRAEMAKCHDSYMMKAWDGQEQRPVPPILVECGRAFSTVPSPVLGAAEPLAADPEPELWRRQEERRKQEEEEAEARRERFQQHRGGPPDLDAPLSEERPHHRNHNSSSGGGHFVDVDDMKVEKVEMSFENVTIPTQPPKKKKRKKKLL